MLRQHKKIVTILIGILITLIIIHTTLYPTKKSPSQWDMVRPSGFPEILTAPESAYDIKYHKPSDATKAGYIFCFHMNESYPAEETLSFIESRLRSHGWYRLEHSLLNPNLSFIPYRKWFPNRDKKSGKIWWRYNEDWLNENDENITVYLFFYTEQTISGDAKPSMEELEKALSKVNNLFVEILFYETNSWVRPFILKYKEIYPDEFNNKW